MLGKIEEQMKSQGADEAGLQSVRSSMKQKKKLLDEFAQDRRIKNLDESVVSINHDQVDT